MPEKKLPEYGTPGYIFDVRWHDEKERDYLVVVDAKPESEVMNARAKGTNVYDLLEMYGGIDEVEKVFTSKGVMADVSATPQFGNDDEYSGIIYNLQKQLDELKAAKPVENTEIKKED